MSDLMNVNETLRAMLSPLEGTVQGKAVKFALHFLETGGKEIDRLRSELAELKSDVSDLDTMHVEAEFNVLESRDELAALTAKVERLEAENAELRANALDWKIVTEDPTTLPEEYRNVIVKMRKGRGDGYTAAFRDGDQWAVTQHQKRGGLETCSMFSVSHGDRWAYIPEVPHE